MTKLSTSINASIYKAGYYTRSLSPRGLLSFGDLGACEETGRTKGMRRSLLPSPAQQSAPDGSKFQGCKPQGTRSLHQPTCIPRMLEVPLGPQMPRTIPRPPQSPRPTRGSAEVFAKQFADSLLRQASLPGSCKA